MLATIGPYLLRCLALATAFAVLAVVGLNWATVQGVASPVFPAAGIAVAGLVLGGIRLWPAVFIGALAGYALAGANLPWWTQVMLAGGNALGAALAAWALARLGFRPRLARLRDALALIFVGAGGMSAAAATIGAATLWMAVPLDAMGAAITWSNWFFGDMAGILTIAPLVLAWRHVVPSRPLAWWIHFGACAAATVAISWIVFMVDTGGVPLEWLVAAPLIWAALAFEGRAALMATVVAAFAVAGTTIGHGPFGDIAQDPLRFVLLQVFATAAAALVLVISALTSELRRSEALRASQQRFRTLVTATANVVWSTGPDGRVNQDSPTWRQFTGQSAIDWLANRWGDCVHPEDLERVHGLWSDCVLTGRIFEGEMRIRRADGGYCWTIVRAAPVRVREGAIREWIGAITDISDRKRAEEVLRHNEAEFRAMADVAPAMTWLTGPDHRTTFVSRSLQALTGLSVERCTEYGWTTVIHPDDVAATARHFRKCHRARVRCVGEYRLRDPEGNYHWVLDIGVPRYSEQGDFMGFVGNVVDIDDRKRAEEALKEADRRKDEFLATLAHELRNPLAPIRTGLQLLKRAPGDSPAAATARGMMERQLRHMVRLVDDLLDLSRISAGKVELRCADVELTSVVDAALEATRSIVDAAGHELIVHEPPQPLWVHADAARLSQVVSNLVNNAAKYTPDRGTIRVQICAEQGCALVRVSDTGVGIEPDMLPRVFEIFTQVGKEYDRARGGLGIGLALSKQLVELHGGWLEGCSQGLGCGSTFTMRLPLAVAPIDVAPVPAEATGRSASASHVT
jgi:PAS domain S-box-containing protein